MHQINFYGTQPRTPLGELAVLQQTPWLMERGLTAPSPRTSSRSRPEWSGERFLERGQCRSEPPLHQPGSLSLGPLSAKSITSICCGFVAQQVAEQIHNRSKQWSLLFSLALSIPTFYSTAPPM